MRLDTVQDLSGWKPLGAVSCGRVEEAEFSSRFLGEALNLRLLAGLDLLYCPSFPSSSLPLKCASSLDRQTRLTQNCSGNFCLQCSCQGQALDLPRVFPSRLYPMWSCSRYLSKQYSYVGFFNSSFMCHLFPFPVWLFLNILGKILFLVGGGNMLM